MLVVKLKSLLKPEPEDQHVSKRKVLAPQSSNPKQKSNITLNGGGVSKKFKGKGNANQEKTKYAKLKPAQLSESISLFNGKQQQAKQQQVKPLPVPKKAFEKTYVVDALPSKKATLPKPTIPIKKKRAAACKLQETPAQEENPFDSDEEIFDSRQKAIKLFKRLIYPMETKDFFK